MAAVRRDVKVVVVTREEPFPAGTADPGFHYKIEGSNEGTEFDSPETSVTFAGVISGSHTVTVSKLGFSATADIVVPTDGNISVPVTVTLSLG